MDPQIERLKMEVERLKGEVEHLKQSMAATAREEARSLLSTITPTNNGGITFSGNLLNLSASIQWPQVGQWTGTGFCQDGQLVVNGTFSIQS